MNGCTRWPQLATFCLFVGYGRSGHSAIGSVIDAHPGAVVAHEYNAVKHYFEGVPRDALFDGIYTLAQRQAREGRYASRAGGGTYAHNIDGQAKPDTSEIKVLGDKKGAGTAWQFHRHGLHRIEDFTAYIGLPVKMLHVIRNPYDIVAAGIARGGSDFAQTVEIVSEIRRRHAGDGWLDVRYEEVIAHPREQVERILGFLGLPLLEEHLERCVRYLYREPHRRRLELRWPAAAKAMVDQTIDRHDFLRDYTLGG